MVRPIINHKDKYIYFMIPKNACSSMRHLILQNMKNDFNLGYNIHALQDLPHIKYKDIIHYRDYHWFTILRNPYDRILSAYYDKVKGQLKDQIYKPLYCPQKSFSEFIDEVYLTKDFECDAHIRSQYMFLPDKSIKKLDSILFVETLESDIKNLKTKIKINGALKKIRKTNKKIILSDIDKEKIYLRYKKDFEVLKKLGKNYV